MDTASGEYGPGDLRVSDADRDRAIGELSQHFQAGRLTLEEFDERSGQAVRAKTGRDLAGLFTDLPAAQDQALDIWDPRVPADPRLPQDAAAVPGAGRHVTAARVIMTAAGIAAVVIVVSLLVRTGLVVHAGVARRGFSVPVPLLIVLFIVLRVVWRRPRRRNAVPDDPAQDE
jgi:hypothetical protein